HSSQPDKVSISNSDTNAGILEAISIGNSAISATYNNITATENIEVSDAILTGITLQSDFLSLAKDSSSQLQAIGSLSNGHTQNISSLVNWSSDAPDILSIDNSKNKKGIITAKTSGTANISATLNNISESTTITVSNATLASIEVSHQNVRIANGTKLNIIATGIYSDGTHQNITQDVLWLSDNPASVFVSNEKGKKGDAYSLSVGSALVSATQGSTIGTSNITVNAKLLSAITILADGNNMLAAGNEVQLKAIGNYSDGSILDISNQVTWQSSDNKICIVSTSEQHYGLIKAKTAGTCNVTAKAEQVSNSLLFTISDATLQSISISPNNTSLPRGTKIQLIATGLYSDATTSDISKTVSWKSNNIFTSISEELNTKGLLSAIDIGSSTITATYDTISATSTATVNAATLESIAISALITGDFINGTTKTYIATGTYSDQSTQDISQLVLWVSSDTTVSTANNSITSAGKFSGIAAGAVSLSAAFNGITSSPLNTTVIDVPLAPVSLSLRATPNIILNDGADTSSISLNVQAADNLQAVADGTEIQLSIINGSGIISSSAVTTINGEAAFNITSTTKGLVTVKATITGTEISNYVSVYATDNFAEVIAKYGFATGSLVNGLVAIDSKFGFLIINFANRPFIVNGYRVFNGNTIITETSDPAVLNNNLLPAGGNILVVYASTEALSNNYVVAYYLTEPDTGSQFAIIGGFQLSSTNPGPVP
ncbi:MAG: Ig-like domain-containing protein, partial [Gammaproteobacteria bacterium]|nr:Ig-like domain-containing protein [Gammaproteobacteria bacterium]